MFTIKNGQILLYCHYNKIIKEPEASFQSPAFSGKDVRNVCHNHTSIPPNFILIGRRVEKK